MTAQGGETGNETSLDFVLERTYDAPRELVWKALTEAERLAEWWGPKGVEIRVKTLDVRPGGAFHYCMVTPQGEIWGKFVFREIDQPSRLVFTNGFADADGNFAPSPYHHLGAWPLEVLSIWTLDERDGKTTFTLRGRPHNATPEQEQAWADGFRSMQGGWTGTLDVLGEYLQAQK